MKSTKNDHNSVYDGAESQNLAEYVQHSARKKAIPIVFIWVDKGYPADRFEYKTASERYLVAEL